MRDFQGRSSWKCWVYSRFTVAVLAILLVALIRPVWSIYRKSRVVVEERSQVAAQLAELESRKAFLEREITRLQTERGVEGEIRKKFPVVREGEKVIVLIEEEATTTEATSTSGWLERLESWLDSE